MRDERRSKFLARNFSGERAYFLRMRMQVQESSLFLPCWFYARAHHLYGIGHVLNDIPYRGISPMGKRSLPQDPTRTLGTGLR